MTWEEIKPVAEAILGEGCGAMTLDELWAAAERNGYKSASDLVKDLETKGNDICRHRAIERAYRALVLSDYDLYHR